ncbi:MAG: hypothetical protein KDD62_01730 [Bdellovibrionales bacterium]|nr:hypothetical protein [Bdellovibrionales bacterium]
MRFKGKFSELGALNPESISIVFDEIEVSHLQAYSRDRPELISLWLSYSDNNHAISS